MHICFISNEFPTPGQNNGGIGTMIKFVGEYLASKGVRVSVIGEYNTTGITVENGVNLYRYPMSSRPFVPVKRYYRLNQWIRNLNRLHKIDFVETPELGLFLLRKIKGITYVIRMHGGHHFFALAENRNTEFFKSLMEKYSFSKADKVLAVSEYVKNKTLELLELKKEVTVINNPIDIHQFTLDARHKTIDKRIVFVGSVVEKKGIRQLIMAMPEIRHKHPTAHLIVVGRNANFPGTDEPYFPFLQKFLPEQNEDFITFAGGVPHNEVAKYIASAEVCVYPSHMEALPLAWLEALCMAKPFIGGKTGPGPEVVKHAETGLLADPYSPEDIAKQVITLFDKPSFARRLGENAYQDVQKRFRLEIIGEQNLRFFESNLED